jgi:hypothetical protein
VSRRGLAIATACVGGFLAFLDTTIVNTACPGIAASFPDASAADLAWVLDAFGLESAHPGVSRFFDDTPLSITSCRGV